MTTGFICIIGMIGISSAFFGLWQESAYAGVFMWGLQLAWYMTTKEGQDA